MDRKMQRLVEGWLARHPSANTQTAYRRDLVGFLDWCAATGRQPLGVGSSDIDAYRDECLSDGAGAATVGRRLSGIGSFYRYAAQAGAVRTDPVEGVDRPPSPDPANSMVLTPTSWLRSSRRPSRSAPKQLPSWPSSASTASNWVRPWPWTSETRRLAGALPALP